MSTCNEVILLQGEAMQALEAAVASLVRPGMHVLNLVSGVFGAGMGNGWPGSARRSIPCAFRTTRSSALTA